MQFVDIVSQPGPPANLRTMVRQERLPHALILLGPSGCGKLALAIATAQYLLCDARSETDACGECQHCRKVSKLIHPDLHFSFPSVGTNALSDHFLPTWREAIAENPYLDVPHWLGKIGAENKQGNINKEECLNIIKKLSLKTFEAPYKVMIIWRPELLGKEGNRLLKIIEEPPEGTHFILVAEDPEKILNTILSRCQLVKVPKLSDELITDGLIKKGIAADQARQAAFLAEGDFFAAQQITQAENGEQAELLLDWLRKCYRGVDGLGRVTWVEGFAKLGREAQKHFFIYTLHFMRELYQLVATGNDNLRLPTRELASAKGLAPLLDTNRLEKIVAIINDCHYHIERNANPKILMLDASIRIQHLLRKQ